MSLNAAEFQILNALYTAAPLTQRQLQSATGLSLGAINTNVRSLEAAGYIQQRQLTPAGLNALQPYKVDNAIIMAAGMSRRFAPISYERPKGTLKVRGEVLIERQIKQLQQAGINDITVVVGYKKEYFFYLAKKFNVQLVINDDYLTRNNNGSLYLVRDKLRNTYICSSDDYFTNNPFETYVYQAYYSAQYVAGATKEWCLKTGSKGRITGASIGGADAWIMLGHAYFDKTFSKKFCEILQRVYEQPDTPAKLWESIYLEHVKELNMVIRKYPAGMINEFDSVDEIRSFDPNFMENVDSAVFDVIAQVLNCTKTEIHDFYPLKQGITNLSCHFSVGNNEYVYRHPGMGTDKIIDRKAELEALELAGKLGLDHTFLAGDPQAGWKIARFVPQAHTLDPNNDTQLAQAMRMAQQLHGSGKKLRRSFDFVNESLRYEALLTSYAPIDLPEYTELRAKVLRLKALTDRDQFPPVPSHNDFFPLNFLVTKDGHLDLIDWEYAGMSDLASDFGTMVVCAQLPPARADLALRYYLGREPTAQEHRHFWAYVVFAGWCWYVWALLKEASGENVGHWLFVYYRHASDWVDQVLQAYENSAPQPVH